MSGSIIHFILSEAHSCRQTIHISYILIHNETIYLNACADDFRRIRGRACRRKQTGDRGKRGDRTRDRERQRGESAGYEYSYITKDELVHTPDFFELNLKLNYTFVLSDHVKLQLNGGVQNMLNAFQKDLDKGAYRDSGYFYGPVQPRTFFIGVKITN